MREDVYLLNSGLEDKKRGRESFHNLLGGPADSMLIEGRAVSQSPDHPSFTFQRVDRAGPT
jgi:hypothetical protein